MSKLRVALVALLFLVPAFLPIVGAVVSPIARPADRWGNSLDPEPNTPWDIPGYMWQKAPGPGVSRAYLDAVLINSLAGTTSTASTGTPIVTARVFAFFGEWRDCNADGYIGHGALGLLEYPLGTDEIDPSCVGHPNHVVAGTVHEFRWFSPNPVAAPDIHSAGVRVWSDVAGPDERPGRAVPASATVAGDEYTAPPVSAGPVALGGPKRAPDAVLTFRAGASAPVAAPYPYLASGRCERSCPGWLSEPFTLVAPSFEAREGNLPHAVEFQARASDNAFITTYARAGSYDPSNSNYYVWGDGTYGFESCGPTTWGVHRGWDCDRQAWAPGPKVGDWFNYRDVDKLRLFETADVYDYDHDGDGMEDEWERAYDIIDSLGDIDSDNASALTEYRWDTHPAYVPLMGISMEQVRDHDMDDWLDGDEIRYWNATDEGNLTDAVAAAAGNAMRDPDAANDTDADGYPNIHDEDSDGDGIRDGAEYYVYGTYPEFGDSDCATWATSCTLPRDTTFKASDRVGAPGTGDLIRDQDEILLWTRVLGPEGHLFDCDGDGIPNILDGDSDGDGWLDGEETDESICDPDADDDGLYDGNETRVHRTDPFRADTDGDGMPDGWEVEMRLSPLVRDGNLDPDADQLDNLGEYRRNGDPWVRDTDGDLLDDGAEVRNGTRVDKIDTDGDRMPDGWEVMNGLKPLVDDAYEDPDDDAARVDGVPYYTHTNLEEYFYCSSAWDPEEHVTNPYATDPRRADSNFDGVRDGDHVVNGTSASATPCAGNLGDLDEDGLLNGDEIALTTSVNHPDHDGDRLCDGGGGAKCVGTGFEVGGGPGEVHHFKSSPFLADTDRDGCNDHCEAMLMEPATQGSAGYAIDTDGDGAIDIRDPDADDDGLKDGEEIAYGTAVLDPDTDHDGLTDPEEIRAYADLGVRATVRDTDGDGLSDGAEVLDHGTDPAKADTDGDGLSDEVELEIGSSPFFEDTDRDGMPDGWEVANALDPRDPTDAARDEDGDGLVGALSNLAEYVHGTNPRRADTDGDLLPDGWEVLFDLAPTNANDATADHDGDGATNLVEWLAGTRPRTWDTDGDGLSDGGELGGQVSPALGWSDPTQADTDGDGIDDGREKALWGAAWIGDLDRDGILLPQLANNLRDSDSDNDGLDDGQEFLIFLTDPAKADTDGDGYSDFEEVSRRFSDPLDAASTHGASTGIDTDRDGLSDEREAQLGTDPTRPDSDNDGMMDGREALAWGRDLLIDLDGDAVPNLLDFDSDGDGVGDGTEFATGTLDRTLWYVTSPRHADSDLDELVDGVEARNTRIARPITDRVEPWPEASPPVMGAWGIILVEEDPMMMQSASTSRSSPSRTDSDGDRLPDGREINLHRTDPYQRDSDSDGIEDFFEPARDSDGDGLFDGVDDDSDGDSIKDGEEDTNANGKRDPGETSARDADTDDDGLCDDEERSGATRTDAVHPDTDRDGLPDGLEMRRATPCARGPTAWTISQASLPAGRQTWAPYRGSNTSVPTNAAGQYAAEVSDFDEDGILDGIEDWNMDGVYGVAGDTDPTSPDSDDDRLPDGLELLIWGNMRFDTYLAHHGNDVSRAHAARTYAPGNPARTNPRAIDTDADGVNDSYDITPASIKPGSFGFQLESFEVLDPIDWGLMKCHWYQPELVFDITIDTAFGSTFLQTPQVAPNICGPGYVANLLVASFGMLPTQSLGSGATKFADGFLSLELPQDVTKIPGFRGGDLDWDDVTITILARDEDCSTSPCRQDATDVFDLQRNSETDDRSVTIEIELMDFVLAPGEAENDRSLIFDGSQDDDGAFGDDDAVLGLKLSTLLEQRRLSTVAVSWRDLAPIPPGTSWGV